MTKIRLAVIGMGKIARDQHLPSIASNPDFELVATASRSGETVPGIPSFQNIDELAASGLAIDAVALCTPPQVRREIATKAIAHGWHVFLEKPPGATLAEVHMLSAAAEAAGVTLFASWHSRYAAGVEPARAWLAGRRIQQASIIWREDVRVWHPGQDWIWEPGGFGVFDPGINALSIATKILPRPFHTVRAELDFPGNRQAPIAARVDYRDLAGVPITMNLDFRQEGPQSWDIIVATDDGTLTLSHGGEKIAVNNMATPIAEHQPTGEYPALYVRFVEVIRSGVSDIDLSPLRHVADAFLCGRRNLVEEFTW